MLVVDIEASGTEYSVHSIVSIGAFDIFRPEERFYGECQVWEGAHVMDEALAVNGFSVHEITDQTKPTEADLTRSFLEWSEHCLDRTIVGQNPSFDRDFLRHAAQRAHLSWSFPYRTIDTHTLCYMHMVTRGINPPFDDQHKHSKLNLDAILEYCGIPEEPSPHNALTGALCHGEVAYRLLYNRSLLKEFSHLPLPWS